jgi:hypothetical protein
MEANRRRWLKNHPDYRRIYSATHRLQQNRTRRNSPIQKKWQREYYRNPAKKLAHSIRVRIRQTLKGLRKTLPSQELMGCDVSELKSFLESKFSEGMNWGNHSRLGWHIDHVIPLSWFNLSDIEEQKKAFHFTNLHPLWAYENCAKGNRYL